MNRRQLAHGGVAVAIAVVAGAVLPDTTNEYWVGLATTVATWIALTESWVLFSGMTGYVSLGHAVFVGTGAYVMALTWNEVPLWAAIAMAGALAAVLAAVVGAPCLRVRGPYFVILTLGVAEFGKFVAINVEASLGSMGRVLLGAPSVEDIFLMMLALAVIAYLGSYAAHRSRFGMGLRAIREDEAAAEPAGVPTASLKIIAFVLSAIIPGMVGSLMVLRSGYFEPLQSFNPSISLNIIAMAVIGGTEDAPGPLFGTLFLTILSEALWSKLPQLYMIILGILLIAFVLWVDVGIYGYLIRWTRRRA